MQVVHRLWELDSFVDQYAAKEDDSAPDRADNILLLDHLNRDRRGDYCMCDCPICGEHEAYFYITRNWLTCNRQRECKFSMSIDRYLEQHRQGPRSLLLLRVLRSRKKHREMHSSCLPTPRPSAGPACCPGPPKPREVEPVKIYLRPAASTPARALLPRIGLGLRRGQSGQSRSPTGQTPSASSRRSRYRWPRRSP